MTRPIARIDLDALQHNYAVVQRLAPASKIMAMVKANAYGHGMVRVAKALPQADAFGVARLHEALELRAAGITQEIVILEGVFTSDELVEVVKHNLTPVVHLLEQLILLEKYLDQPLRRAWLKIDTGMHRLGISPAETNNVYQRLIMQADWVGCMSHFSSADELYSSYVTDHADQPNVQNNSVATTDSITYQQFTVFRQSCADIVKAQQSTSPWPAQSLANSAAIMAFPQSHMDWVRPGIMLYGASPFKSCGGWQLGLRPVMSLTAEVLNVRRLQKGETVGYGATWRANEPSCVATVAAGYADGIPWQCGQSVGLNLNIEHQPAQKLISAELIGRVSMDSLALRLDDVSFSELTVGDRVVLFGSQLNSGSALNSSTDYPATADVWANASGSINYAVLSGVSARCLRV